MAFNANNLKQEQLMTWFEELTGFSEQSPEQVRSNLVLDGERLTSKINGKTMICGQLETPSLAELRERVSALGNREGKLKISEAIADVKNLHLDAANAGALFQVASQFNLLERISPNRLPEDGVGIYEYDGTQGPACAIAAGAGTIYRNYFVPVNGQIGQTSANQIDCLADIGQALGNTDNRLWKMRNGYALASRAGLEEISERLRAMDESERERLRGLLKIGIQWNTQITLNGCTHSVTQAYCSALPVAYSDVPPGLWEDFARLVLEAAYETTICAALLNAHKTANNRVYLTLLGGGAFGNAPNWITDSIQKTFKLYENKDIDAVFVSRAGKSAYVNDLIRSF